MKTDRSGLAVGVECVVACRTYKTIHGSKIGRGVGGNEDIAFS